MNKTIIHKEEYMTPEITGVWVAPRQSLLTGSTSSTNNEDSTSSTGNVWGD